MCSMARSCCTRTFPFQPPLCAPSCSNKHTSPRQRRDAGPLCLSNAKLPQCMPWVTGNLRTAGSWRSGCLESPEPCWEPLKTGSWEPLGTGWKLVGNSCGGWPLGTGWELHEVAAPRDGTAWAPRAEHLGTFWKPFRVLRRSVNACSPAN